MSVNVPTRPSPFGLPGIAPTYMMRRLKAECFGLSRENMLHYFEIPSSENELYLRLFITNGGGW